MVFIFPPTAADYERKLTMFDLDVPLKKIEPLQADSRKFAEAVHLVYVNDRDKGILRKKSGKGFVYFLNGQKIVSAEILERIKMLAIPPAWKDVWICDDTNGHLQVTGLDARNRKQYRYHPVWNALRNDTKFFRMYEFGSLLPQIRKQVNKNIREKEFSLEKVIATVIRLMEHTYIRIGNASYEKENGTYGLTTLKNNHVKVKGANIQFSFKGKKGIQRNVSLNSKRMARIVKQCKEIPGKELFQYIDEQGQRHPIDSGKVNAYIREVSGKDFSAKDFRTWAGSLNALRSFIRIGYPEDDADLRKNILAALDETSRQLGNTRNVCRKYYVHPCLLDMYESKKLRTYFEKLNGSRLKGHSSLSREEKLLMMILHDSLKSA